MGLFDDFMVREVDTKVYRNKNNTKIKKEKKKDEDKFLTREEIRDKKRRAYLRRYWANKTEERRAQKEQCAKERDEVLRETPIPLTTPNEIDALYLDEYAQDIGGEQSVGKYSKWETAYGRQHPSHFIKLYTPIKLIYSLGLERRYNNGIEIQCNIYNFLKDRVSEIMDNYSRDHWKLRSDGWYSNNLYYWAINGTRSRKIIDEWESIYGTRGSSMMFQAVKDIYKYGYWSPLQGLHGIASCYLIGDVMYDGFGHCDYISNFGNDKDYLAHRNELHDMAIAARDKNIKKEDLDRIPYFMMDSPVLVRVPSNKIFDDKKGEIKSNNCEYDYYWMSLCGMEPFPKWSKIEEKFGPLQPIKHSYKNTKNYVKQIVCKRPYNLYLEER